MKLDDLMKLAPVDFEQAIDGLTGPERGKLADEAYGLLQGLAWAAGYVDRRYGAGCGDQGHTDAVKYANKLKAGVRKVLGYSYPKSSEINV
jgi:hypothetical protein